VPTWSAPRMRAQIPASNSSAGVEGATKPCTGPGPPWTTGSAARSSFPFGVSGTAASSANSAGTMNSGNRSLANCRNWPAGGMP
jgi:hypothetical protein